MMFASIYAVIEEYITFAMAVFDTAVDAMLPFMAALLLAAITQVYIGDLSFSTPWSEGPEPDVAPGLYYNDDQVQLEVRTYISRNPVLLI